MKRRYQILLIIVLIAWALSSCIVRKVEVVDTDDLYFRGGDRGQLPLRPMTHTYYRNDWSGTNWFGSWYGWNGGWGNPYYSPMYQHPRTIIVVPKPETPKYNYGKRPDRSGGNGGVDIPLNRKRGRQ